MEIQRERKKFIVVSVAATQTKQKENTVEK